MERQALIFRTCFLAAGAAALLAFGRVAPAQATGSPAPQAAPTDAAPRDPLHRFPGDRIVVGLSDPGWVRGLLRRDEHGKAVGFAADLVSAAAAAVDLEVVFIPIANADEAVEALGTGRVDLVSPLSITEERLTVVDFTGPILITHCAVFSRLDTPAATTPEQLAGARVTVARDGIAHRWCVENGVPLAFAGQLNPALDMVLKDQADYCVTTQLAGRSAIESNGITGLVDRRIEDDTASRAFALAVAKGNEDLLFDMNKGLALVRDGGQWDRLYDHWLERYQPRPHPTYLTREMIFGAGATLLAITSAGLVSQWVLRRRLARQAELLRESEAMYRAIAESMPALIYTHHWGRDGTRTLRYESPRAQEWRVPFPFLRLDEDWTAIQDRIHPEDQKRFAEAARRSRAEQSRFDVEFRLRAGDGRYRWIHWLVTPLETPEGVLCQGLLLDVTEQRVAEEERQRLEAQLFQSRKLEGLGVLAGGIAHDFNNLMGGVVGNLELARANLTDAVRAERYLRTAEGATLRAAELTQQLLAYAGKARLAEETIDIDSLVVEMLGLVKTALKPSARVSLDLHAAATSIRGDGTLVRQLAMNLLTNASDALPDSGGDIHVRSGLRHFEAAYLARTYVPTDLPSGEYVFLEVEDTGSGMDEETLQRIFDPFFTTKFAGRGLGLAVVLKTMQRHRGAVKVTSRPGAGTRFLILFPPARALQAGPSGPEAEGDSTTDTPRPEHGPAAAGAGETRVSVLVVDDEPLVRDVARTVLEGRGWRVETAADGDEALRLAGRAPGFDLVLLDMTMPGLGGAETLAELHRSAPGTRVVLMSGFDAGTANGEPPAEARGFLRKPFTGKKLVQALETALAKA
ncbi:MAG: transporter substrate-binding domain-containing protein [Planctomycetes bacterium]|nr:transporter substrate-binding domain-containing protein [Planctomycetota bacterium]